jgi:hypothetical protein
VALYHKNTGKPDMTHTAGSLDDLVLLAYRSDGVDISLTREPKGRNNREIMASLGLTRDIIKRRLCEGDIEPTAESVDEAICLIKGAAHDAAHDALVAFVRAKRGSGKTA